MSKYLQDLFVSYTRAVEVEAMLSEDGDAELWEESKVRLKECRARLVDAIEKLEGGNDAMRLLVACRAGRINPLAWIGEGK